MNCRVTSETLSNRVPASGDCSPTMKTPEAFSADAGLSVSANGGFRTTSKNSSISRLALTGRIAPGTPAIHSSIPAKERQCNASRRKAFSVSSKSGTRICLIFFFSVTMGSTSGGTTVERSNSCGGSISPRERRTECWIAALVALRYACEAARKSCGAGGFSKNSGCSAANSRSFLIWRNFSFCCSASAKARSKLSSCSFVGRGIGTVS